MGKVAEVQIEKEIPVNAAAGQKDEELHNNPDFLNNVG